LKFWSLLERKKDSKSWHILDLYLETPNSSHKVKFSVKKKALFDLYHNLLSSNARNCRKKKKPLSIKNTMVGHYFVPKLSDDDDC